MHSEYFSSSSWSCWRQISEVVNVTDNAMQTTSMHCNNVEVTSAVSCLWASLAATKCWESSSFSTANWRKKCTRPRISIKKKEKKPLVGEGAHSQTWLSSADPQFETAGVWSPPAVGRRPRSFEPAPQRWQKFGGWTVLRRRRWGQSVSSAFDFVSKSVIGATMSCLINIKKTWQISRKSTKLALCLWPLEKAFFKELLSICPAVTSQRAALSTCSEWDKTKEGCDQNNPKAVLGV